MCLVKEFPVVEDVLRRTIGEHCTGAYDYGTGAQVQHQIKVMGGDYSGMSEGSKQVN